MPDDFNELEQEADVIQEPEPAPVPPEAERPLLGEIVSTPPVPDEAHVLKINGPRAGQEGYDKAFQCVPRGTKKTVGSLPVAHVFGVCDGGEAGQLYRYHARVQSSKIEVAVTPLEEESS